MEVFNHMRKEGPPMQDTQYLHVEFMVSWRIGSHMIRKVIDCWNMDDEAPSLYVKRRHEDKHVSWANSNLCCTLLLCKLYCHSSKG